MSYQAPVATNTAQVTLNIKLDAINTRTLKLSLYLFKSTYKPKILRATNGVQVEVKGSVKEADRGATIKIIIEVNQMAASAGTVVTLDI